MRCRRKFGSGSDGLGDCGLSGGSREIRKQKSEVGSGRSGKERSNGNCPPRLEGSGSEADPRGGSWNQEDFFDPVFTSALPRHPSCSRRSSSSCEFRAILRIISGQFGSRQLKERRLTVCGQPATSFGERCSTFWTSSKAFSRCLCRMGGVGIEAISRGAGFVHFVDSSQRPARSSGKTFRHSAFNPATGSIAWNCVRPSNISNATTSPSTSHFDPPPIANLYTMALEFFGAGSLLKESGILIMEHSKRYDLGPAGGVLSRYRLLNQGDSCLSFYRKDA